MKRLKIYLENVFFLRLCPWSLALASSIPVLGLESVCPRKGCPWPWPRIFFVSLASDFFCVLGLGLEPCVLDFTSANNNATGINATSVNYVSAGLDNR